jgi:hypothetical protein
MTHPQPIIETTVDLAADLEAMVDRAVRRGDAFAVQAFADGGARLYERQRKAVVDAETAHALSRAALIDQFRVKVANLRAEATEALRKLDAEHDAKIAAGREILLALDHMRGAG